MYRQFGFAPVGIRKGYYAETNEDALVMWARDIDTPEYGELLDGLERRLRGHTHLRASPALVTRSSGSRRAATRPRRRSSRTADICARSVVSSQVDLHAPFGGVVPEIASRAHVELISGVIAEALVEAASSSATSTRSPRATARGSRARCSSV